MAETYQSLSHSRCDCKYHVVFVPKRRPSNSYNPSKFGEVNFADEESLRLALLLANSKLMMVFWFAVADDFDVTRWNFDDFPTDLKAVHLELLVPDAGSPAAGRHHAAPARDRKEDAEDAGRVSKQEPWILSTNFGLDSYCGLLLLIASGRLAGV